VGRRDGRTILKENAMDELDTVLKEIRTDMRNLKNQWVFKPYHYRGLTIETKRYNTWFQIFRIHTPNGVVNAATTMDATQKDTLAQITKILISL